MKGKQLLVESDGVIVSGALKEQEAGEANGRWTASVWKLDEMNLNGRICAEGLLVFGIGGLAIVYAIAPMVDDLVNRFNERKVMAVCTVLMVLFFTDMVYSQIHPNTGKGVTDIEEAREMHSIQQISDKQIQV